MKTKKIRPIFTGKIEKFNHEILFKKSYKEVLRKRIEGKHGIYALYDKDEKLYYIGQTSQMRKRIMRHHQEDHRVKKWETFSVLFTRSLHYPTFLEDALISIIGTPKGNRQKPLKIKKLNNQIEKDIREVANRKVDKMVGKKTSKRRTKNKKRTKTFNKKRSSKSHNRNPFKKRVTLRAEYKGKEYTANWLQSGKAKYKNKTCNSPHAVAQIIVDKVCGRPTGVAGTRFWTVQKAPNKWVRLCDL